VPGELCGALRRRILSQRRGTQSGARQRTAEQSLGTVTFRDELIDAIRAHEKRFHEDAFLFVLAALRYAQSQLPVPRHVDGRELAYAVRDLALERFGLMARLVLEYWGVRTTADLGDIVFAMVDAGLLASQPSDSKSDFQAVYDFDEAFDACYPWSAAHLVNQLDGLVWK
jgi:uncharacterized repeat protein (TIGR04138 family)